MPYWWKRYEPLLETKPISGEAAVVDLLSRELCDMLEAFPPAEAEVDWEDDALARRFRGRLAELPRPDAALVDVLAQIVRWDLQHETDAIDHLMRNGGHKVACPTAAHDDALHLLWRGVLEFLYARKDETKGLLKTRHVVDVVEAARARFQRRYAERQ